ncbi:MAG: polysaccharide biosynthesis C-terminal domain-containing protein [Oscillospiraceae bacterium]|nr:polysaccharide biosynthesis C-terminal domain-containing protein [Oscillospiraceae bacterium]
MMKDIDYQLIKRKYREFFFPVLFISMSKYLTSFVDSVLVSAFLGVEKMSAVNLCFPAVCFISLFHGMFGIGGSLVAANAYADHDRQRGNRVFSVTMTGIVLIGIVTALGGTLLRSRIVPLLCSDVSLQKDVESYYSLLVVGFPLMCLLFSLSYFVRSDGSPRLTSYSMLISNGVNLFMDWVLMKLLGMGLEGAAAATVIGYVCGIVFMLTGYIKSPKRQYRLVLPLADGAGTAVRDIGKICSSGFSTASVWLYLMISLQVMNRLILNCCGLMDIHAFSVCRNSVNICYVLFLGIAQTLSPIAGVYAHSGDYDRVRFLLKRSILYVTAAAVGAGLVFALFPQLILLLYRVRDPVSAAYLCSYLRVYALAFPGIGFTLLLNYYFQAIKRKRLSAVITLLEGLLLPVGLSLMLTPAFKMQGIMAAMIASEAVTAAFIIGFLLYDRQRSRTSEERIFLLPKTDDSRLCEFSVRMDIMEIVQAAKEVSHYIEERTDHRTASIVCLALEEMLTGIAKANDAPGDAIDVVLRQNDNDIIISIRDMGVGFDPTVRDEALEYDFDNAMMLQSIASEIKYDLSLGMNDTVIRLSGRT